MHSSGIPQEFLRNSVNSFLFGLWGGERLRERQMNARVSKERNMLCTRYTGVYLQDSMRHIYCYPLIKPSATICALATATTTTMSEKNNNHIINTVPASWHHQRSKSHGVVSTPAIPNQTSEVHWLLPSQAIHNWSISALNVMTPVFTIEFVLSFGLPRIAVFSWVITQFLGIYSDITITGPSDTNITTQN